MRRAVFGNRFSVLGFRSSVNGGATSPSCSRQPNTVGLAEGRFAESAIAHATESHRHSHRDERMGPAPGFGTANDAATIGDRIHFGSRCWGPPPDFNVRRVSRFRTTIAPPTTSIDFAHDATLTGRSSQLLQSYVDAPRNQCETFELSDSTKAHRNGRCAFVSYTGHVPVTAAAIFSSQVRFPILRLGSRFSGWVNHSSMERNSPNTDNRQLKTR